MIERIILTVWLVTAGIAVLLLVLPRVPRYAFVLWGLLATVTAVSGVVLVLF